MLLAMFLFGVVVGIVFTCAVIYFGANAIKVVAEEEMKYDETPELSIIYA